MSSERYRAAAVAGGALGVLGAVLPWVAAGGFELDVHSVYALVACAAVVAVAVGDWSRRSQLAVGVLAAVTTALALEAITDFASDGPPPGTPVATSSPGVGAYLALAGGILALAGVALARSTT
ncbi:hypothetical protein [Halorubellus sp. PRR65]|uniref:hypothetical protein n=1 Tax=Halorubellus sp. PRR65 TaxID=3098148 RepID=UPI002B25E692|nr:hypothetical protein [Halorubellus sp. PRR65]